MQDIFVLKEHVGHFVLEEYLYVLESKERLS